MIKSYEINSSTLLIMPNGQKKTKVIEDDEELVIGKSTTKIIDDSCLYFGSSLIGRQQGTKKLINVAVKAPIIIEESKKILFFPTSSPRLEECIWVSYNNLIKYTKKDKDSTILYFKNNKEIEVKVSYNIIDNQIVRCIKLEKELYRRKKII